MFKEDYEKVKTFCEENGINVTELERGIFCKLNDQYDLEDIKSYCENEDNFTERIFEIVKTFDEGDFVCIRELYRDDYDCNYGTWDNVERAIREYIYTRAHSHS